MGAPGGEPVHEDVHHPVAVGLYYDDQKPEAARRARDFTGSRMPKFLGYFEHVLVRNRCATGWTVGDAPSYVDLSLFQLVAGLRYAFPNVMLRLAPTLPRLADLYARVAARPNVAAYLASARRLPFDENGLFRHYPELDA